MKLISGVMFLAVLPTFCVSTEPTTLTYADNYARNVWVESVKGMCSGVILSTGQIITAKHCQADVMTVDNKVATVVKVSAKYDLILLSARTDNFGPLAYNTDPKITQSVHAFVNNDAYKSVYTDGRIVWFDEDHIFSSTLAAPGVSGAAIYDTYGRLIGILTQIHGSALNNNNGIVMTWASAVPAKQLREFMAEAK